MILAIRQPSDQLAVSPAAVLQTAQDLTPTPVNPSSPESDTTIIASPAVKPEFAARLVEAKAKAKIWQSDARLKAIVVSFKSDEELKNAKENFVFGSSRDLYNWWTMAYSGEHAQTVRALVPREDLLGTTLADIPDEHLLSDYQQAHQLIRAKFGQKLPQQATVSAKLMVGPPQDFLWWTLTYQGTEGVQTYRFNPKTLELTEL